MGQGIRRVCGKCYATKEYDSKLQHCNKCGWTPITDQTKLTDSK